MVYRPFCAVPGVESSKNKPVKRRESLLRISNEKRTRQLNHSEYVSFSGLQLKKYISKCLHKDDIVKNVKRVHDFDSKTPCLTDFYDLDESIWYKLQERYILLVSLE